MIERAPWPWWVAGGEERCRVCLQRYVVQVEVRCVACDLASCPFCARVVRATRERFCVGCSPPDAEA